MAHLGALCQGGKLYLMTERASSVPPSGKGDNALNFRDISTHQPSVRLILNASPNAELLNSRAKVLNDAGYYTSSARTPEEAAQYAASMNCDLALICYSFPNGEKKALSDRLRRVSPDTTIVCLEQGSDDNHGVFVSRIQEALKTA